MKLTTLFIVLLASNAFTLSIFGLNMGDTTIREVDTSVYIAPLKKSVKAKLHYEYGRLQIVESILTKNGKGSAFSIMKNYFCHNFGNPIRAISDSSENYFFWIAENCCFELIESKKDSTCSLRIDSDGKIRLQMIQQMEQLYDSITVYRKKK
jgi:hypothetical protein